MSKKRKKPHSSKSQASPQSKPKPEQAKGKDSTASAKAGDQTAPQKPTTSPPTTRKAQPQAESGAKPSVPEQRGKPKGKPKRAHRTQRTSQQPQPRPAGGLKVELAADEPEPRAEARPLPVVLVGLLALMLFWGDMYVVNHGADLLGKAGSFPALVYDPFRSYAEVENANPKSEADLLLAEGKVLFEAACGPCHQSNGMGNPANNIPPLVGSEWVLTPGPGRIIRIVLNAVQGPITVKGQTWDNPGMPPWRDVYNDEQIAAILTYVRGNPDWGHNASPVTPEQVKAVREATADRGIQWTAQELLQVLETE